MYTYCVLNIFFFYHFKIIYLMLRDKYGLVPPPHTAYRHSVVVVKFWSKHSKAFYIKGHNEKQCFNLCQTT